MQSDAVPPPPLGLDPALLRGEFSLRDGAVAKIRPIRPEDEPMVAEFHRTLSERSVYYRYFTTFRLDQRIAHERLARVCFIDHDHEMALVVEYAGKILAIGRLSRLHEENEGEFAVIVSDAWQGHGLGAELLRRLIAIAKARKFDRMTTVMLGDNYRMQALARKAGFKLEPDLQNNEVRAVLEFS